MKTLALLLPAMRMGGAEKIALNFIPQLTEHFKVTVILNSLEGELLDKIPEGVEVVEDKILSFREVVKSDLKHLRFIKLFRDLYCYMRVKFGKNNDRDYRYLISRTPMLDREFDIAISYVANVSTQIFSALDRTNAKEKIAWIHGETAYLNDVKLYTKCYEKFDKIFCVSRTSMEHFVKKFPTLEDKCDVYYNPINKEEILRLSNEEPEVLFDKDCVNILSVGRLAPEKGYDMVPEITKILLERGHKVNFYIIGDGPTAELVNQKIKGCKVENSVHLLGTKTNPYPYMKACDIYVQPSYEEGYSTTICEAGILGCAIVGTTASGGIREQVEDGVSALLAEPAPESIAMTLERYINDKELYNSVKEQVINCDFSKSNQIMKLIGEKV